MRMSADELYEETGKVIMDKQTVTLDSEWRIILHKEGSWVIKATVIDGDVLIRSDTGETGVLLIQKIPVMLGGMVQMKADGDKAAKITLLYEGLK